MDVPIDRIDILNSLVQYIKDRSAAKLNFICTHNSRRSQLAQVWAQTAAYFYGIPVNCFSGGTETTAFNENAVNALNRQGFEVKKSRDGSNPVYSIYIAEDIKPIKTSSKLYNDPENPESSFAAIMTCSDADEKCPFIPGADIRIPLNYDDPKIFDGTGLESQKYMERSLQIASEMFYAFSKVNAI